MKVIGQLEDAQLEHVSAIASETPKLARIVLDTSTFKVYIGNGFVWKSIASETALGDIRSSILTETQFQIENGSEWIIADGRDITGSDLAILLTETFAPDLRGVFLRGKDNGRGINPDGDLPLGQFTSDKYELHNHLYNDSTVDISATVGGAQQNARCNRTSNSGEPFIYTTDVDTTRTSIGAGSTETAPKSVTVNYFIKINRDLGV